MLPANNRAFKEWAVVCQALAEGRQIAILRKGGILEGPSGFEVTDGEFFLFPTFSHQSAATLIPEWRGALSACQEPELGTVVLSHYAVVAKWLRIERLETLHALRGLHIWSDEQVEERFHRWADDGLFALMVRVYTLPHPVTLELREEYTGCKSWVTLAEPIPLDGVRPVLPNEAFAARLVNLFPQGNPYHGLDP